MISVGGGLENDVGSAACESTFIGPLEPLRKGNEGDVIVTDAAELTTPVPPDATATADAETCGKTPAICA